MAALERSIEGPEEGALLELGFLGGDEEGWAKILDDPDGEVSKAHCMVETRVMKKAHSTN